MKFLILSFFCCSQVFSQNSIYDLEVRTPGGGKISMAHYKDRKILIISIKPDNIKIRKLQILDSLQKNNSDVVVVLIPARDIGEPVDDSVFTRIHKNFISKNFILSAGVRVKKTEGQNQNLLLQWLTHADQNRHFDVDVTTDEQMYVVSESGILYAVLEEGVPLKVIKELLQQADVRE